MSPIGVDLSRDVAELEMVDWTVMLMDIVENNQLVTDLDFIYVDDVRDILTPINNGWEYDTQDKRFKYDLLLHQAEDQEGVTPTMKSLKEMGKIYNNIKPHLRFTLESLEDYPKKRLPTLDCEIWLDGKRVVTNYYHKPTKTPYCIMATSAMPQMMIENSLTQEVGRRLTNTSMTLNEDMILSMEELITRMTRSSHSKATTGKILSRGLNIYTTKIKNHMTGKAKVHRRARESMKDRRNKKLTIKMNWFKPKGTKTSTLGKTKKTNKPPNTTKTWDSRALDTAMFVPRTPGGALATHMRQTEKDLNKISGFKIKIVEECGGDLKGALVKSNPWSTDDCERADCPLCTARREGDEKVKGSCKTESITYTSTCTLCAKVGHTNT